MKHVRRFNSLSPLNKSKSNWIFIFHYLLGERRKVLNWLLSYNPLWLRIGLEVSWHSQVFSSSFRTFCHKTEELVFLYKCCSSWTQCVHPQTIYGELISLESNNDTLGLAMFILQRLLWNPDIAAEFRHAKVPHLYKDGNENTFLLCLKSPKRI